MAYGYYNVSSCNSSSSTMCAGIVASTTFTRISNSVDTLCYGTMVSTKGHVGIDHTKQKHVL